MRLRHAIVLVVAALVGAACTGGPTETRTIMTTDAHTTGPTIILTSPKALNATDAPLLPRSRFALPEFDYGTFQQLLTQVKGTPVVVNIWASWCGQCREEAGKLAAAAREFGSRVQFIGVDIGDQREAAQQTIRDFGWSYPSIFDPNEDVKHGLGLLGQPDTLFYDRQGNPVTFTYRGTNYSAFSGPIPSQAAIDSVIRQLLR